MDALETATAMNNLLRLRICLLLEDKTLSLGEITRLFTSKYKEKKDRETIYRALEILVKNDIVDKFYDKHNKKIHYAMMIKKITINFDSGKIDIERK